jgi:hypothetical protein
MHYCVFFRWVYLDRIATISWFDPSVRKQHKSLDIIFCGIPPDIQTKFRELPLHFIHTSSASILRWIVIVAAVTIFAVTQTAGPSLVSHLYRMQLSTGQIVSSTWHGAQVQGATRLASARGAGWILIGASEADRSGTKRLVYVNKSSGELAVSFYGGAGGRTFLGSTSLATLDAGWTARAVADIAGNGNLDVITTQEATGQVGVYFFGGPQGTTFVRNETISSLSATGWSAIGAADLNGDGHPDLLLQDSSTRQVMVAYLAGSNGTTVTATQVLNSSDFRGWTAAGMQDMNGDGHPDLILTNDATGESIVNYYGGELGVAYLGSEYVDRSGSPDWKLVVPSILARVTLNEKSTANSIAAPAGSSETAKIQKAGTTPILIFNGTGTGANAVAAIESVVKSLGLGYHTANSSQLGAMSQAQLAAYQLFIVPGGNSIKIGNALSSKATTNVRNAVAQNGLNYLGLCAGGFFGGYSKYHNGLNLTSGVWFNFYADYNKGIHKEAVTISFPSRGKLDIYWQDGPQLSGWGQVIGKYPNGTPALTEGTWGKGLVILSGVHPEAPASWRNGMHFSTPVDVDLAYAGSLVTAAMTHTMLPHY